MSNKILSALSLALIAVNYLTACGGGAGSSSSSQTPLTVAVGGTVSGLPSGVTVLLVNNNADTISVAANGNFVFDKGIALGALYNVTLYIQPTGAYCTIANGNGTASSAVTNISVTCESAPTAFVGYNVGITVSGLKAGNTAVFMNNGTDSLTVNGNGLFVFPQNYAIEISTQGSYDVTVSANPTGQTCSLSNASGSNLASSFKNFVNVTATCN